MLLATFISFLEYLGIHQLSTVSRQAAYACNLGSAEVHESSTFATSIAERLIE